MTTGQAGLKAAMRPEEERNQRQRCARTACQDDISRESYVHKHLQYRYCRLCARRINAACPEAPPFDLGVPAR